MPAELLDREARVAQTRDGRVVVVGEDRDVAARHDGRRVGVEKVDVGPVARDPCRAALQPGRGVDVVEAEQRPEAQLRLDVVAADLERRVLEGHGVLTFTRSTFSAWILRCAFVRRAGGSGASGSGSARR